MTINADDILSVTKSVTKKWTKQRKAEERGTRSRSSREHVFSDRVNCTDVVEQILPRGYQHASGNGQYSVSNRQMYYAVREAFKDHTNRELGYTYFASTLLVQFLNRHPEETASWKITADPRGTLSIPNAAEEVLIPCGTLQIDRHLDETRDPCDPLDIQKSHDIQWPSLAGGQRYQGVLYIEKEGFGPLMKDAKIAERFDLAVISCKGQSVVAARRFVDAVCAVNGGVPLYSVHDFDKAGFEISQRLTKVSDWAEEHDRVTYRFENTIDVTDLGLRLADVEQYGLGYEKFPFKGYFADDSICTAKERKFLLSGRRVELNAFTSPQFIEWLVAKLTQHGLAKRLIPVDDVLEAAYRRAVATAHINSAIEKARDEAIKEASKATMPKSLKRDLRKALQNSPDAWDKVLYHVVKSRLYPDRDS